VCACRAQCGWSAARLADSPHPTVDAVIQQLGIEGISKSQVSGSVIGACVQVPDYDLMRLIASVRYSDNEVNLQATDLPVPEVVVLVTVP